MEEKNISLKIIEPIEKDVVGYWLRFCANSNHESQYSHFIYLISNYQIKCVVTAIDRVSP